MSAGSDAMWSHTRKERRTFHGRELSDSDYADGREFCKRVLDPDEYEAFTLSVFGDKSYREIATVQGLAASGSGARRRVENAKKKLSAARGQSLRDDDAPASVLWGLQAIKNRKTTEPRGDDLNLGGAPCYVQRGNSIYLPGGGATDYSRPDRDAFRKQRAA